MCAHGITHRNLSFSLSSLGLPTLSFCPKTRCCFKCKWVILLSDHQVTRDGKRDSFIPISSLWLCPEAELKKKSIICCLYHGSLNGEDQCIQKGNIFISGQDYNKRRSFIIWWGETCHGKITREWKIWAVLWHFSSEALKAIPHCRQQSLVVTGCKMGSVPFHSVTHHKTKIEKGSAN